MKGRSSNQIIGFIQKPINCLCSQKNIMTAITISTVKTFSPSTNQRFICRSCTIKECKRQSIARVRWQKTGVPQWVEGISHSVRQFISENQGFSAGMPDPLRIRICLPKWNVPPENTLRLQQKTETNYDSVTLAADSAIAKLSFKQHWKSLIIKNLEKRKQGPYIVLFDSQLSAKMLFQKYLPVCLGLIFGSYRKVMSISEILIVCEIGC